MALRGGPTAGNGASTEACGPTERLTVVAAETTTGTRTAAPRTLKRDLKGKSLHSRHMSTYFMYVI